MSAGVLLAALGGVLAAFAVIDVAGAATPRWHRVLSRRRAATPPAARDVDAPGTATRRRREAAASLLARYGVRTPDGLRARLAAAGISHAGAAEQAMALKCAAALCAALVVLPIALRGSAGGVLLLLGGLPAAGFLTPDLIVARRARRRARLLRAQAPELLERVRLGAEAGLGPQRVLALATERDPGLLAAELRAALTAAELGMSTDEALRSLCERCPVPEVHALAAALRRSARYGVPLAHAAGALAASSRAERARRVHERAQGAAPKIQLVVALLLVPAALLLIAAALLTGMR